MDAPQTNNQKKGWCFTVNNPYENKEIYLNTLEPLCSYIVIGDEIAASGTPHLQGYLELKKKVRFAQVKAAFPTEGPAPHLEARRGTKQQAADYCKKDGNFVEFGSLEDNAGHRTDLDDMCKMVIEGNNMLDVAQTAPSTWVRNYRGIGALQQLIFDNPREYRPDLEVHLYYGRTNTGKTYKVMTENPGIYKKPVGKSLWFDGMPLGCKTVLIDEFTGQYPLSDMLQLLDKYKMQVEVKGGHAWFDVDKVFVTTNLHIAQMYQHAKTQIPYGGREEQGLALMRRFTKILWFRARDDVREIQDRNDFWYHPEKYE